MPGAQVPGLQPLLLDRQWPLGECPFPPGLPPPSSCAVHASGTGRTFRAGRCVPRRKQEAGWEIFRRTWAWGTGRKACAGHSACPAPQLLAPEGAVPLPHPPPRPAPLGARLSLALAPVARGQSQLAPWPGDKGHPVPGPGLASGRVTLSPSVPIWGWGQTPQGDRPSSCPPPLLDPQIGGADAPQGKATEASCVLT